MLLYCFAEIPEADDEVAASGVFGTTGAVGAVGIGFFISGFGAGG
jgi:ammonia channel protein AmtB